MLLKREIESAYNKFFRKMKFRWTFLHVHYKTSRLDRKSDQIQSSINKLTNEDIYQRDKKTNA